MPSGLWSNTFTTRDVYTIQCRVLLCIYFISSKNKWKQKHFLRLGPFTWSPIRPQQPLDVRRFCFRLRRFILRFKNSWIQQSHRQNENTKKIEKKHSKQTKTNCVRERESSLWVYLFVHHYIVRHVSQSHANAFSCACDYSIYSLVSIFFSPMFECVLRANKNVRWQWLRLPFLFFACGRPKNIQSRLSHTYTQTHMLHFVFVFFHFFLLLLTTGTQSVVCFANIVSYQTLDSSLFVRTT